MAGRLNLPNNSAGEMIQTLQVLDLTIGHSESFVMSADDRTIGGHGKRLLRRCQAHLD